MKTQKKPQKQKNAKPCKKPIKKPKHRYRWQPYEIKVFHEGILQNRSLIEIVERVKNVKKREKAQGTGDNVITLENVKIRLREEIRKEKNEEADNDF